MLSELRIKTDNGHTSAYITVKGSSKLSKIAEKWGVKVGSCRWWFVDHNWNTFVDLMKQEGIEIPTAQ